MSVKVEWGESYEYTYEENFHCLDEAKQWVQSFSDEHGIHMLQGYEYKRSGHWFEVYVKVEI